MTMLEWPLPHNSHFNHVLKKRTTKPAEISICHVVWDSQHTKKWLSSHLKISNYGQSKHNSLWLSTPKLFIVANKLLMPITIYYQRRRHSPTSEQQLPVNQENELPSLDLTILQKKEEQTIQPNSINKKLKEDLLLD